VVRAIATTVAACLCALLAGCGGSSDAQVTNVTDSDGLYGIVMPKPYAMPDVQLTDSHGDPYDLVKDTTKPLTLLFFGYTHCPDVCLVVMSDLTAAIRRLPEADRSKVGMLFITSDPQRDDPATLRRYLDRFDPSFEGVTGTIDQIKQVGKALGVAVESGQPLGDGGYAVVHGSQVLGELAGGSVPLVWTSTSSAKLAGDLEKVLDDGVPKVKQ
jgi:protein SCO1